MLKKYNITYGYFTKTLTTTTKMKKKLNACRLKWKQYENETLLTSTVVIPASQLAHV